MRKLFFTVAGLALLAGGVASEAKKVLDHNSFDDWKGVRVRAITNDGNWAAYEVNPQEGDGVLTFRNTRNGKEIVVPRGSMPEFTADGRWGVAKIKPFFQDTRKAKIDKKKDFDMPQDSLLIVNLATGKIEKIPQVISFRIGKEGGDWLAYLSCDTALITPKALKDKEAGRPLVVRNLPTGKSKIVKWVNDYSFSKNGLRLATTLKHHSSDSIATDGLGLIILPDTSFTLLDRDKKFYGKPVFNEAGSMLAYTVSNDSNATGTKRAMLYLARIDGNGVDTEEVTDMVRYGGKNINLMRPNHEDPEIQEQLLKKWAAENRKNAGDTMYVNQYSVPVFANNGRSLVIGVAPAVAPNDSTIYDFETAELDIWRWDAPMTPPQENHRVESLRKHTYPYWLDLFSTDRNLLSSSPLETVEAGNRWDSDWALVRDPSANIVERQWNYYVPEDIYIVNVRTGERRFVGSIPMESSEMSPEGKYVYWFADRNYYVYDVASGSTICLTEDIEFPLWDEDMDRPAPREPYGYMGWLDGDKALLVYDRHDIWSLDPTGKNKPVNLTAGEGRKKNLRYRYVKTDDDQRTINPSDESLLAVFDYTTKKHGFATMKAGKAAAPALKTLEENTFTQLTKAKNAPVFAFQKSNFSTSPNVYISNGYNLASAKKVTDANPQMKDYNWGTAELVKWHAYNGQLTEGVLYKPEDFDPNKKYPMLVVFYETNSEQLYRHYAMEPSWSWVNYPFYVSRGYVILVPDVHYAPGIPGESAYNYICSGVEELCKKYPWIDKEHIGIDGQSWGGYQTSYLVTRTNMFACAGSGAPVANMTSAFGGIRWENGASRQAQYEVGQSRIGRNLWDAPQLYIANSPVFYADRVNTPLLIMHNDADGAVPWYQGIEMFMALRRLGKPVWMLQYNGEAHNIRARKNRKDITIRLQQFFDHYLKGAPMPEWMKEGIPATRKGQEMRTGLVEE